MKTMFYLAISISLTASMCPMVFSKFAYLSRIVFKGEEKDDMFTPFSSFNWK